MEPSNTKNNPYFNVPFLPIEDLNKESQHGAQFFRNVKQLQVGFGSSVFRVDRDGMWAGAEQFASAPWRVDWDGNMVANSVTLSGYIQTGGALNDIGTGNITETYIANGAIVTDKIAANAVIASKIDVDELSAIVAVIGTIYTAASGHRVVINGSTNNIEIYNSSNDVTVLIDGSETDSEESQIRVGGGIFIAGDTDAEYAYGTDFHSFGFGATGIASIIEAIGNGESGACSIRSDGEFWHYGDGLSPVLILTANGGIEAEDDIFISDGNFEITGDGFFNLAQMSGTTASGTAGDQDGSMYYRTDDDVIRVKLNGTWRTITTS